MEGLRPVLVGVALLLFLAPAALAQQQVKFTRPAPDLAVYGEGTIRVEPGEWTRARYVVENRGNYSEALRFGLLVTGEGPMGEQPFAMRITPSAARLEPNSTIEIVIELGAFPDAVPGDRAMILDIAGAAGLPLQQIPLTITIAEAPAEASLPAAAWLALGGAATIGAALWGWRRVEWVRFAAFGAIAPLYTRLAASELLAQERRETIYRLVENEPGIHFSELLARSGMPNGVVVHHLRTLERHRLIVSRREGVRRRFAITGAQFPEPGPKPLTPMQARVIELLEERPRTQRDIAEALGLSQQGANRHVKALERRGNLEIRYVDGEWRCHAAKPTTSPLQSS